jgi:MFS family permease
LTRPSRGAENVEEDVVSPVVSRRATALKFVVLIGVMSFFADFTYEGSRSVVGPYLHQLGAGAFLVAFVAGFGELLGYAIRLVSGRLSDRTGEFWPITIFGYIVQMSSVPLLALAGSWPVAAGLVVLERIGKAIRNPPRDAMLAHAAGEIGYGWAFGVHEALDQFGALFGPLFAAVLLAWRGEYEIAFAALALPAAITLALLASARLLYPRPDEMETTPPDVHTEGLPRLFWLYLGGAALVAAGFADFPFIAFHFQQAGSVPSNWIPVLYAVAMGVSGTGSLVFGRLFDRRGLGVLIPLTVVSALYAPLVFLGGFAPAVAGMALWGLGMGVHESIIPAAVAVMVPSNRRASAFGLFTAGYGVAWFAGSLVLGALYTVSRVGVVAAAVILELAAVPLLLVVRKRSARTWPSPLSRRPGHP